MFSFQFFNRGPDFLKKLLIRIFIIGYASSREGIEYYVQDLLNEKGVGIEKIDIDSLKVSENENLVAIAKKVKERIDSMEIEYTDAEILRNEILKKAYIMIYG